MGGVCLWKCDDQEKKSPADNLISDSHFVFLSTSFTIMIVVVFHFGPSRWGQTRSRRSEEVEARKKSAGEEAGELGNNWFN
jgi:hypothetical protein